MASTLSRAEKQLSKFNYCHREEGLVIFYHFLSISEKFLSARSRWTSESLKKLEPQTTSLFTED